MPLLKTTSQLYLNSAMHIITEKKKSYTFQHCLRTLKSFKGTSFHPCLFLCGISTPWWYIVCNIYIQKQTNWDGNIQPITDDSNWTHIASKNKWKTSLHKGFSMLHNLVTNFYFYFIYYYFWGRTDVCNPNTIETAYTLVGSAIHIVTPLPKIQKHDQHKQLCAKQFQTKMIQNSGGLNPWQGQVTHPRPHPLLPHCFLSTYKKISPKTSGGHALRKSTFFGNVQSWEWKTNIL